MNNQQLNLLKQEVLSSYGELISSLLEWNDTPEEEFIFLPEELTKEGFTLNHPKVREFLDNNNWKLTYE